MIYDLFKPSIAALVVALPGFAPTFVQAGQVSLPAGCTAFVTVQQRQCLVTHHYTCDADPAGHQWRVDLTDQGVTYVAQIDREAQWVYSLDFFSGTEERLTENPVDPASMDDLLAGEVDTWDFQTIQADGTTTRFYGYDLKTGTATIDGVDLLTTEAEITAETSEGEVLWSAKGSQYVHAGWRMFLFGTDTYVSADGTETFIDHSPVDFIFPGEPGFLSEDPSYDCEVVMSSYSGDRP